MPVVPAKCPSCGGDMQLDDSRREAFCPYCGTMFLVESAISYFNAKSKAPRRTESAAVRTGGGTFADSRLANAETYLVKHRDYAKAEQLFKSISGENSGDWRAWWGVARAMTREFSGIQLDEVRASISNVEDEVRKAFAKRFGMAEQYVRQSFNVAEGEEKRALQQTWETYKIRYGEYVDSFIASQKDEWDSAYYNYQKLGVEKQQLEKQREQARERSRRSSKAVGGRGIYALMEYLFGGLEIGVVPGLGVVALGVGLIFHLHTVTVIGIITQIGWLYRPLVKGKAKADRKAEDQLGKKIYALENEMQSLGNVDIKRFAGFHDFTGGFGITEK